jgi:hypothetical protein
MYAGAPSCRRSTRSPASAARATPRPEGVRGCGVADHVGGSAASASAWISQRVAGEVGRLVERGDQRGRRQHLLGGDRHQPVRRRGGSAGVDLAAARVERRHQQRVVVGATAARS